MDILSQKKEIRKEAKSYRKSLSENDRLDKSIAIVSNLKALKDFQKAKVILMYASLPDEVETLSLIRELTEEGKRQVYCPVTQGDEMEFYRISSVDDLKEGNFYVLEPEPLAERRLVLQNDVHYCMLMPGLMFDKTGNRLGYGKGYYDKYLARVPKEVNLTTVALSYDAMVKDAIPAEETDWRADYIVTEDKVRNVVMSNAEIVSSNNTDVECVHMQEYDISKYKKCSSHHSAQIAELFQYFPQIITDKINKSATKIAFEKATKDTYKVILDKGTHLAESHQIKGAFIGAELSDKTNDLVGQAKWLKNDTKLSVPVGPDIALGVFNAVSMVTGQYFMSEINDKLSDVTEGLKRIEDYLENDKRSKIKGNLKHLEYIYQNYTYIKGNNLELSSTKNLLKTMENETLQIIISYYDQIYLLMNSISINDDIKKVERNIISISNSILQYRTAIYVYCLINIVDIYLSNYFDNNIANIYNKISEPVEQYKDVIIAYKTKMKDYIEESKALNKRNGTQIAVDTASAIIPAVTLPVIGQFIALKLTPFVDEKFNDKRQQNKEEKEVLYKDFIINIENTTMLDEALENLQTYMKINDSKIEFLNYNDEYYFKMIN